MTSDPDISPAALPDIPAGSGNAASGSAAFGPRTRTRSISPRGWLKLVAACLLIFLTAVIYRMAQPGSITRITEHKFYAIVYTAQPEGTPIPGAAVVATVIHADGSPGKVYSGMTNEAGRVELYYDPGVVVRVRISKTGYRTRQEEYFREQGVRPDDKPLHVTLDIIPPPPPDPRPAPDVNFHSDRH